MKIRQQGIFNCRVVCMKIRVQGSFSCYVVSVNFLHSKFVISYLGLLGVRLPVVVHRVSEQNLSAALR